MKILIVEDDELNAFALSAVLTNQNYVVEVATDGNAGWDLVETYDYDLILLDVMLPKLDGISLCRQIRASGRQMPILLLTGCDSSHEKAIGLDAGADDYVVKPFAEEELVARVRALLRRSGTILQTILECGNLHLDPSSCEVTYGQNLLSLTPKEYSLLELFLRNRRRVFSCSMILEHLWSYEDTPGEDAVRTHIKGLRMKLRHAGASGELIETVYGIGYRLNPQEEEKKGAEEKNKSHLPTESQSASTLAAIAGVWEKFYGRVDEQVGVLEKTVTALHQKSLEAQLQLQAKQEAHTLAGSLGTFGLPQGSKLARKIEQLLKSDPPWTPGEISKFQKWVKLLRQEVAAQKPGGVSSAPQATSADIGTMSFNIQTDTQSEAKVLAVDDDPKILALLQTLLHPWGLNVITLDDPRKFWDTLKDTSPDLLILDVEMPHISGIEICQAVRNDPDWSELPILFLTVHSDAEIVNQVYSVGADDFVSKPIIGPELVTRIINRLERVKLLRRVAAGGRKQEAGVSANGMSVSSQYEQSSPTSTHTSSNNSTKSSNTLSPLHPYTHHHYKQLEAEIQRVHRTLQTLSDCNQALIRADNEDDLLHQVCEILIQVGGYRLAWVAYAENTTHQEILPVAQAGYADGYLQSLNLTWADTIRGQHPMATAIRTRKTTIIQNILADSRYEVWRCQAMSRGYAAVIALPLISQGQAFGALNIYAVEPDAFDVSEVKLLEELTADLAYGILALRNQRDRQRAEAALQAANNELELRVAERTAELVTVNQQLQSELDGKQRIEAELRISQIRLARILDIADDAIISFDRNQRITLFNQGAEKIFGYSAQEVMGQPLDILLPARFAEAHRQHVTGFGQSPSMARRMGERREIYGCRRDGTEFPAEASISKLHMDNEVVYTVILRDITERKQVDRMKDEFVSVVSHELRTPLTSIQGSLGMLTSGLLSADSDQGKRLLQIAADSTERLVRLINDILDIERIESGKVKMEREICDLTDLIESAVSIMQPLANKAGVKLVIDSPSLHLWIDPDRIVQTLTNLLSNAIKFSPPDSTVWLVAQPYGDEVLLTVKDTGRGIPTDKIQSIFERFQQVDSSDSRNHDGTGLGLAICQSIVQQHGGRIWVESVLGEGSTFHFTLPIMSVPPHSDAIEHSPFSSPQSPVRAGLRQHGGNPTRETNKENCPDSLLPSPLVLVCDDDRLIRLELQTLLEKGGYRVVTVATGEEAIAIAANQHPDVIVLDLLMPGMNGWETMALLKAQAETKEIPIVICSVYKQNSNSQSSTDFVDWVSKPVQEHYFLNSLRQVLATSAQRVRILIVEDDPDLVELLITLFSRHGIETFCAKTGREAIHLSQEVNPDLLILDLILPETDGFAVVDWLQKHNHLCDIPLVVYSAKDLDESERQRLKLGDTEFLTKGRVTTQEFEQRVIELLQRITHNQQGDSQDDN